MIGFCGAVTVVGAVVETMLTGWWGTRWNWDVAVGVWLLNKVNTRNRRAFLRWNVKE